MNIHGILVELRAERDRIERAIAAIEGLNSRQSRTAGRQPSKAATRTGRRRMSAAARRKLSRLMKQRWAKGKMKPKASARPAASKRGRLSQAARKRIAAAQRARWAKVREQQAQKKAA